MTLFARYYANKKLVEYSMTDIENLIDNENNKEVIANVLYHRYYDRYLKLFFYSSSDKPQTYTKIINGREITKLRDEFDTEYKSGFVIMTNCCLLIETIASFFEGSNETSLSGPNTFKLIFEKASAYNNPLKVFSKEPFYTNIRCGLLHQGETYGNFKIRREGELFNKTEKVINAKLFCDYLRDFLESYRNELVKEKWDSETWDKCRLKLRHIIKNSRQSFRNNNSAK